MDKLTPSFWSYATSFLVGAFSLTLNEFVALTGLALAILTFLVNWFYKHRHYQLVKDNNNERP